MIRNTKTLETLDILSSEKDRAFMNGYTRDIMRFRLRSAYDIVLAFFADGAVLEDVQEVEGAEVITSMSDYCLAGDITDHRDGTFTVIMGAMTEDEKSFSLLRDNMNIILPMLNDEQAISVKTLYGEWEADKEYKAGERFMFGGYLHKVILNHTSQKEQTPDIAYTLYECIDETHTGTAEDPIFYNRNMVLENGKYYSEKGVIYICTRDSVNAVYHALSDLVGHYVEVYAE